MLLHEHSEKIDILRSWEERLEHNLSRTIVRGAAAKANPKYLILASSSEYHHEKNYPKSPLAKKIDVPRDPSWANILQTLRA